MKRVVISSIVSMLTVFALANCSGNTPSPEANAQTKTEVDPEAHTGTIEKKNLTQEKVSKIIHEAAEKAGWEMTEFKSNAFIAEKIDGENSVSTTITFSTDSFDISPQNSELEGIVADALK